MASNVAPEPKPDRRTSILDAAERCFGRAGFHQASMHEICLEAGMSPGNLYRYFPSKETLIAGIAERNRNDAAESFALAAETENFFEGLQQLARHHLVDRSEHEVALCTEIMAESRRNPAIAKLFHDIEVDVKARIRAMLVRAAERGEINGAIDFDNAATMLMVLADGMSWRRAADPAFNAESMLPLIFQMVRCLLTQPAPTETTP
ncbi:MAG: TetR/AcrR family transcriptional regulator [Xanthobacteraceae bacterium]|nr:MAG: TetR/AcrR family transcriptional regulator [Xanthobacteraceae bacterium]